LITKALIFWQKGGKITKEKSESWNLKLADFEQTKYHTIWFADGGGSDFFGIIPMKSQFWYLNHNMPWIGTATTSKTRQFWLLSSRHHVILSVSTQWKKGLLDTAQTCSNHVFSPRNANPSIARVQLLEGVERWFKLILNLREKLYRMVYEWGSKEVKFMH
jgi:hypothetical protein